ncbi:MAG TPA: MlaD family protein, partial [Polyangiaceae bacterium]|nr:MlaD family protein [Polyangiaceae bacterium]
MPVGRELKVGFFVLIGLVIVGLVVFLIGDERRIFSRRVTITTSFSDVQGLKIGAPVRMDGIDVGAITDVGHSEDLNDKRIHVRLSVVRSEAARLRTDAKAKISNKGLLGDKMLEIDPGTGPHRPVGDSTIDGTDPTPSANAFAYDGAGRLTIAGANTGGGGSAPGNIPPSSTRI